MIPRLAEQAARLYATIFRVIVITGPRQSGKSTLTQLCFPDKPYFNLEDSATRARVEADPRAFLASLAGGAVIDEVQKLPKLLSDIQVFVDQRQIKGDFVLTGSQQFGLIDQINQSLAGRAGMLHLLPLSSKELSTSGKTPSHWHQAAWQGGYPEPVLQHKSDAAQAWFASYISTYIERDVRQVVNVGDLALFRRFLLMCAARAGNLLNLASLAADCGITHTTAKRWLTVLEASYVVTLLQPHHRNFNKRLVRTPKLYFLDTGLLCHLLQIESAKALELHAMRGAVFENWVITETLKHRYNQGLPAQLYFWRDNHGTEIDLLFEHAGLLHAVEMKSGTTFASDWPHACDKFLSYAGAEAAKPTIIYGGNESFSLNKCHVMGWRDLT
jgi:predicted AAA+ superfamily ATPase